jgi:hypothetical protein
MKSFFISRQPIPDRPDAARPGGLHVSLDNGRDFYLGGPMKYVVFYQAVWPKGGHPHWVEAGAVRLVGDALEVDDEELKAILEYIPVVTADGTLWPSHPDKRAYFERLPLGFHGSQFFAAKVGRRGPSKPGKWIPFGKEIS